MTNTGQIALKKRKNRINYVREMQKSVNKESTKILLFTILHLPLGLILFNSGSLGAIHPIAIFVLGMYWALYKNVKLEWIAFLVAYLVGCEVLWRMADTPIYWEFGKYGPTAIMIAALLRKGHYTPPVLPAIFIILLLPACCITLLASDFSVARDQISFNLSGPFFLFVSCWFFSYLNVDKSQIKKLFIFVFIPLLTVATTTLTYTVSYRDLIEFTNESNFATSGGFGPNQVSSMLGLGVFIGFASYILFSVDFKLKLYFIVGAIFLASQSLLTFSRGGIYNALGALAILFLFHLQNITEGIKKFFSIVFVVIVFLLLIFPFMNDFTEGKLLERFEDTEATRRADIAESDFEILAENPIWGVGLGNAKQYRERFLGYEAASHTEFSRLISEHGLFGIFAVIVLVLMTVFNLMRQNSVFGRALIAGVVLWCCMFMLNTGMRLAGPAFLWGLSFINIVGFSSSRRQYPRESKAKQNIPAKHLLSASRL